MSQSATQHSEFQFPPINHRLLAGIMIAGFFLVLLALLHLKFPIFNDETLYSDTAHRLIQGYGLSTTLFEDFIPYLERYSYWYPPLYFYFLALCYQVFGVSITVARLFTLLSATAVLAVLYFLLKHWLISSKFVLIALALLIADHFFQDGAVVARMEMLTLLWGILALFFHLRFLDSRRQLENFLSGLFSAACILTHPIAAVVLTPIGINLLLINTRSWKERFQTWLIYGVPIVANIFGWVVSFWENREIFWLQNYVQLHRKQYGLFYVVEALKYKPFHRLIILIYYLSNLNLLVTFFQKKLYKIGRAHV